MYGSRESEVKNRYFVVVMYFENQPRWRRLQTIKVEVTYRLLNAWSFLSHLFSTIAVGLDKFCL